jgi:hypothetical protein
VRLFIEQHGESRFEPLDRGDDLRAVNNRAGWRKGDGADCESMIPPLMPRWSRERFPIAACSWQTEGAFPKYGQNTGKISS